MPPTLDEIRALNRSQPAPQAAQGGVSLEEIRQLNARREGTTFPDTTLFSGRRVSAGPGSDPAPPPEPIRARDGRPVPETLLSTGKRVGGATAPAEPVTLTAEESVELASRSLLPEALNQQINAFFEAGGEQARGQAEQLGIQFGGPQQPAEGVARISPAEQVELGSRSLLPGIAQEGAEAIAQQGPEQTARDIGRLGLEIGATALAPQLVPARLAGPAAGLATRLGSRLGAGATAGGVASLAAETFDPSEDPLRRAATTAAFTGAGEAGSEFLVSALNRVIRGGTKLVPGAEEAVRQIGDRAQITPGQLSENPLVDVMQNISEESFTGFRAFQLQKEAAEAVANLDVDEFASQYLRGRGAEAVGGGIQDAITHSGNLRKNFGKQLYGWFDELIEADREIAKVTGREVAAEGVDIAKVIRQATSRQQAGAGRNPTVSKVASWVLDAAPEGTTKLSWKDAQSLRSDLLGVGRIADEIIPGQGQGVAKSLAKGVDEAMEEAARGLNPDLEKTRRYINRFWKETKTTFGDRFIKSIVNAEPEAVLKRISRKDMPGTIRKIRRIVLDPAVKGPQKVEAEAVWREVQGHTLLKIARDAQDASLQTQGKRATKLLDKFGDDTLKELFLSQEDLKAYKKLLRTLEITQAPIGEGLPGGVAVKLGQASAFGLMLTGVLGPQALAFVVAPEVIKRVLTNKAFGRWVTIGSKAPQGSRDSLRAFARIQSVIAAETANEARESGRKEKTR